MAKFCSLFSSSKGNCTYIGDGKTGILIDCGASAKRIRQSLCAVGIDPASIAAVFVTHEHSDHIAALRVFASAAGTPVYATAGTLSMLERDGVLNGRFPVHALPANGGEAAGMWVRPFALSHDAAEPVGYSVTTADGKRICVATDTGVVTQEILSAASGSDLILLESNHDVGMLQMGSYPYAVKRRILSDRGHLCNDACAETAACLLQSGTTQFVLGHLSAENNMPRLAYQTTLSEMEMIGAKLDEDYRLRVAGGEAEMIEV